MTQEGRKRRDAKSPLYQTGALGWAEVSHGSEGNHVCGCDHIDIALQL